MKTNRVDRSESLKVVNGFERSIVEHETIPGDELPRKRISCGGVLEKKGGVECLRLADSISAMPDGTLRIRREWLKPGNFKPEFYARTNLRH